ALTFALRLPASNGRFSRLSNTRFTELAERLWSTLSVILKPRASRSNWSMPTVTFACGFATMDAESTLSCSTKDVRDTGVWQACGNGPQELAGVSKSLVVQLMGQR